MWYTIIVSFLIIYILHHIYIYIQESYSIKREKNIVDLQTKKYRDIIDILSKKEREPKPDIIQIAQPMNEIETDLEVFLHTTMNSLTSA